MLAASIAAAAVVTLVLAWRLIEGRSDRRLFVGGPGRVIENLRAKAAGAFLKANPSAQVLDVRSEREFAGGALPGAVNISIGDPAFTERVCRLDPARPVLVYCAGGVRSRQAVRQLRDLGFVSIHHLHRGIQSWRLAGLSVQPTQSSQP